MANKEEGMTPIVEQVHQHLKHCVGQKVTSTAVTKSMNMDAGKLGAVSAALQTLHGNGGLRYEGKDGNRYTYRVLPTIERKRAHSNQKHQSTRKAGNKQRRSRKSPFERISDELIKIRSQANKSEEIILKALTEIETDLGNVEALRKQLKALNLF